jgi:hypothetical protein
MRTQVTFDAADPHAVAKNRVHLDIHVEPGRNRTADGA